MVERLIILEAALLRISNLDYSRAAVNFAALDAVNIAREALKGLGKEDRVTDSIDPVVRSLRHAEEIIAQGPNGLAWPDISSHQIKAEKE